MRGRWTNPVQRRITNRNHRSSQVEYAGAFDESCAGAFGVQVGVDGVCGGCGGGGGHLDVFVGGERIVG
ncbi:MAG: hypothetical protein KTV16_14960 [Acidimicrobiia bacterium]|nr:hypothetical protein [Acidimicrobiia bacterium]